MMNVPGKRSVLGQRRLLGDARRETAEAIHQAASKRRRLADLDADDEEDEGEANLLGDDDGAVFADAVYEQDDVEADEIYAAVDARMESRRQKQRQARLEKELREYRRANPTIRQQFADLKTELGSVSADQWASIPDIGDYSVKKQKFQKFTPAPDSLLERARQETAYVSSEPSNYGTDLASIGAGRTSVLGQKLDNAGNAVSAQANVDADGYLAEMAGVRVSTDTEIGDIKKARLLLKSVTSTNPKHAPGWIAAARLEETAGQLSAARQFILEGCRKCPREEDVWIEAARLYPKETGRRILAQAVRTVPKSAKIWLQASTLEDDLNSRRRVLRKGLEIIPRSAELWKAAVELEEPSGARILLSRAVECVPSDLELWLALARLQPYEEAKETLRRAQEAIPTALSVCITAAQLEEVQNGADSREIHSAIQRGVAAFSSSSKEIKRERWLHAAEEAERSGYPGTVKGIIENTIGMDIEDERREETWTDDASAMERKGCKEVARAVHGSLTKTFPTKTDIWLAFAEFERRNNDHIRLQKVLSDSVEYCPGAELLWLMLAKDKWKSEGAHSAREVLAKAFEANPDSEAIWLAAAKVETESGEYDKARSILRRAREQAPSGKVYMKSALLERHQSHRAEERRLLEQGLAEYPKNEKLWLMLAQWHERGLEMEMLDEATRKATAKKDSMIQSLTNARAVYAKGVEHCGLCVHLWIGYARYEERQGSVSKARAILERARERCKGQATADWLWRESAYLESRDRKPDAARSLVARALQDHKHSGRLWALSMALEPRAGQKAKSVDAIKTCPHDAVVLLEVAKYIWRGGKIQKARAWLQRAVEMDSDLGDGWATWLAFEKEQGDEKAVIDVEKKALAAEPRYGDLWTAVSKKVGYETLPPEKVLQGVAALVEKNSSVTGIYLT